MRQIAVYTALEGAETMKNLSIMIKPASSLCNMRCVYCFYADVAHQRDIASYGLISDDTLETMLRAIFADLKRGDHLNLAFQGGEPTLAGLNFFCSVIRKVSALNQGVHVHYALQTNVSLNNQFLRPTVKGRMAFSLRLLERLHRPSSM